MAKKKTNNRRKLSRIGIVVISALSAILLSIAVIVGWGQWNYRFGSAIAREGVVYITHDMDFAQTAQILADSGYLTNPSRWSSMAQSHGMDSVQMGRYSLESGESYRTALSKMRYGRETPVRLTFNNIRNMERLAGVVSRYLAADSVAMLCTLRDGQLIDQMGFSWATLPAMFIPNTYELYWSCTPEEFMRRMKREYDKFWNADRLAKAEKLGYTPQQIATIASIVIEETKFRGEMSDVAGVYLNRLRVGMPLQADPTLKFAVGDFTLRRVLNIHKKADSPYNTYKYSGLPPGPICIAPIDAIDSVLAYSDKKHDYYYFCAKPDFSGQHAFARSLPEHNRNAAAYYSALNKRGIR